MNRLWVPGRDAGRNLDLFFTFAVAGVLGNRIFLVATGYPQLGNGTLHISHAIWGGVMMLIAIVVGVSSLAPGVRAFVAVLGGAGFGWFVDELGKYITRDVDYFFKPTLALIYAIFVAMYFAFRSIRRPRNRPEDVMLNAIEAMRQGILGRLDEPRRAEALTLLDTVRVEHHPTSRLQDVLIELETVPPSEPGRAARTARGARRLLERWTRRPSFAFVFGLIFLALATADAAEVLEQALDGPGVHSVSEWSITVTCVISFVLAAIGFAALARSRLTGYRWLEASIMVSILITQVFLFHEAQIEATVDLTITLAFWMLLRAAMSVERAGDLAVTAPI
jgi:hypothetical protein